MICPKFKCGGEKKTTGKKLRAKGAIFPKIN